MKGPVRGQYTLVFKQEAVRLVRGGEGVSSVARTLGVSGQTLHNWVKADAAGRSLTLATNGCLWRQAAAAVSGRQVGLPRNTG